MGPDLQINFIKSEGKKKKIHNFLHYRGKILRENQEKLGIWGLCSNLGPLLSRSFLEGVGDGEGMWGEYLSGD